MSEFPAPQSIAIIGLGYVGLPLAIQFAKAGLQVIGIDLDPRKVEQLNLGKSYIAHIPEEAIADILGRGKFKATSDFRSMSDCEGVILCVPTPLNQHREPDISYVLDSGKALAPHLKKGTLISLESTTYPGTTDTDLRQVIEEYSGLTAGEDFHLAYSPEREDPSNPESKVETIPKLVGGYTLTCLQKAVALYSVCIKTIVPVESCRVAEAAKLLENIFRSVNIALVNELKLVYEAMGIDIWKVIEAAKTKPFGFMPFYPGPGLGGHCIPIDPFYLTWKAKEFDQHTRFIELAGEINTSMPNHVVGRCVLALNDEGRAVKNSHVLILGLAYKPNVDDDRESPAYTLIEKLEDLGARVDYHDPYIPRIQPTRDHSRLVGRVSAELHDGYDLILIATNHREYHEHDFSAYRCPIVDTRNCVHTPPAKYYKA